jgi:hypothetical protein
MTIGPAPMIRIEEMSVRLGMSEDNRVHRGKKAGAVYTTGAGQAMREGPEIPMER